MVTFRMNRPTFVGALMMGLTILFAPGLHAEQAYQDELKKEFGFWMGGSFPVPGSKAASTVDSNLGAGGFFRFYWPGPFLLETGFAYADYKSSGTQHLTMAPVYVSLAYPLPWIERFSVMFKLGGGQSYLVVRPANVSGWNPTAYAGFEFSILAARRFRVGLRIDGYYVYDGLNSEPQMLEYLRYYRMMNGTYDTRFYQVDQFKIYNPAFYNFGLMVSFII